MPFYCTMYGGGVHLVDLIRWLISSEVEEVTGISRATCIRKLNRLVLLGFLIRDSKTKRFYVNQNSVDRTSNVLTKNNVDLSIGIYSEFLSIILNSLLFKFNSFNSVFLMVSKAGSSGRGGGMGFRAIPELLPQSLM